MERKIIDMNKIDLDKLKGSTSNVLSKVTSVSKKVGASISNNTTTISKNVSNKIDITKDELKNKIDQNGDGQITIEDVIIMGLKVPGVKINRSEFIKKEFSKYYSEEIIDNIIKYNPAHENIPINKISKIADDVIQYERLCVSGISTALSAPGGFAMVATLPTDIAQYYGYMLRATQELLYLYGFPEIDINSQQLLDSETINTLIVCMGVMYGVAGANTALKSMAKALGVGVEKKLINKALTKGTIYPIVKSVARWFNVRMTKEIFAGFFKKSIPIIGGVIGGSITYLSFKPCCEKLKTTLENTKLSNPKYIETREENIMTDNILVSQ
jgi:hypothetical protein